MNTYSHFSAELSLLVDAALRPAAPLSFTKNSQLHYDHARLQKLAKWHQVQSLLYDFVSNNDSVTLLEDRVLESLKSYSVNGAVYNMLFLRKSLEFHANLHAGDVPAFLMKGALWAWWLYESPGLREFGDIDFFVPRGDVLKSLKILKQSGYHADAYRQFLLEDIHVSESYFNTDYQLPLEPDSEQIVRSMEIQWNTTYPRFAYSFSWEELMSRPRDFEVLDQTIRIPSVDHQLLMMLIHHAGVEQWDKLKFMADFVRLLRKCSDEIDWLFIKQQTQKKGAYRLLLESLGLVKILTGEDYGKFMNDPAFESYPSAGFSSSVFLHWENSREKPVTKSWQIFYFNMIYRDRPADKIRILFKHLAYLLEWRLLMAKARWYIKNKR